MEIKLKKEKSKWLKLPATVPVDEEMKSGLDQAKDDGVDVNQMTRDFWTDLLSNIRTKDQSKSA